MSQNNTSGGIGFFGLLTIVFVVLKLTGVINWSWWLVTAPIWGSVMLWLSVVAIILIFYILKEAKDRN